MPIDYKTARRLLDTKFSTIKDLLPLLERPAKGWIRAIRTSLGMPSGYLAKKLDISLTRILNIEKSELTGDVKLSTLQRVAQALDCQFVYCIIPNESLEESLRKNAKEKAKMVFDRTTRSMALENQASSEQENETQLKELFEKIMDDSPKKIWR